MCGVSSYHTEIEESGLLGEIFANIGKKKTQKTEQQTALLKGMMEAKAERQRLEVEKEANRAKLIRTLVIAFVALIVLVTIIIAIVMLRKKKVENK